MVAVVFVPALDQVESESTEVYWTYTVTSKGVVTGSGSAPVSTEAAGPHGKVGEYTSADGKNVGSWGFDSEGYGPFGSFYAAFDACHNNKMVCHLNPDNLRSSIDANIEIDTESKYIDSQGERHTVNIMWVLPTIYWSVDGSGNLVLSNDPSKGVAYAHTFTDNGRSTTSKYLAIGVYEASGMEQDGKTKLTSTTNSSPNLRTSRSGLRDYANNNLVATQDGTTPNGHAMLWNFYAWQLYRFCVLTVGGGWNSQGIFGNGDVYGAHTGKDAKPTGSLDGSGPYAGVVGKSASYTDLNYHFFPVKAFIENAWGSQDDFVDGVLIYKKDSEVQMYATQDVVPSDSAEDYTADMKIGVLPHSGYYEHASDCGFYGPSTSSESPAFWGMPVSSAKGSASSGLYDSIWSDPKSSSSKPYGLLVGGYSFGSFGQSGRMYTADFGLSFMDAAYSLQYDNPKTCGRLAIAFDDDPTIVPEVTYDHSDLLTLLKECGLDASYASGLPDRATGKGTYDRLEDVAEFKHAGWIIGGELYPAEYPFVTAEDHVAKSVWIGTPAVTYDHSELVKATGDRSSEVGLSQGIQVKGNDGYEQLPSRDGYSHVGWRISIEGKDVVVGPTDGFVISQSHTAVSLWKQEPMVIFDHSNLTNVVGRTAEGVSDLKSSMLIGGNTKYPQLEDTAGYRHVGWRIGNQEVGPTAALVSQATHTAESLWEKASDKFRPIPIIPDIVDPFDPGIAVPVVPVEEEPGFWSQKDGKSLLIIAVIAVIVAELAVLSISRKR